jgi:hypothetical protein
MLRWEKGVDLLVVEPPPVMIGEGDDVSSCSENEGDIGGPATLTEGQMQAMSVVERKRHQIAVQKAADKAKLNRKKNIFDGAAVDKFLQSLQMVKSIYTATQAIWKGVAQAVALCRMHVHVCVCVHVCVW